MATDIFVGSVSVGVVPDARGWNTKLRAQLVPSASRVGEEMGQEMGRKITGEMGKSGETSGGAFSDRFRKRIKAALDALPRDAEGPVAELRRKLQALADEKIIDSSKATRELAKIDVSLDNLRRNSKDIELRFDTTEARAQIALIKKDVASAGKGGRGGFIGNLFSMAPQIGGAGGAGPGPAAGAGGISGTAALYGGAAAAVAAGSPFIAQIISGGFVGALGTALAGVGVLGAAMDKSFQDTTTKIAAHTVTLANGTKQRIGATTKVVAGDFTKFKESAIRDITDIGKPFVLVLHSILSTTQSVLGQMTPIFRNAMGLIAAPFKLFSDTLIRTFANPAVKASIEAVATSFGLILRAITPQLSGMMDSIANGITSIANAISDNPGAFASFINFLIHAVGAAFEFIAWLTRAANYIESHWFPMFERWAPVIGRALAPLVDAYKRILPLVIQMLKDFWGVVSALLPILGALALVLIKVVAWAIQDVIAPLIQYVLLPLLRGIVIGAEWVRDHWRSIFHEVAVIFDGFRHEVAHIWDMIWNNTVARVVRGYQDVINIYRRLRTDVVNWWHDVMNFQRTIWDTIWNNTIGRAIRGWHDLMGIFSRLKTDVVNWFHDAVNWLVNAGKDIISGLYNGIKNAIAGVGNWIKTNVVDPLINAVKNFFGIHSPATSMIPVGRNLVAGLIHGILSSAKNLGSLVGKIFGGWPQALGSLAEKALVNIAKLPAKALNALAGLAGKAGGLVSSVFNKIFGGGGSGVSRWAGTVAQALAMLGLPLSLGSRVLYQMQTESGGNPNAVNNWDINAQMGDPSRGLMQVIGGTFAAYHVPGTSWNIFDPLANIAAALNYARAVYGPSLMRGSMGVGSGHGYDSGGWLPPGVTMAYNMTGSPELVLTQAQLQGLTRGGDGGATYVAHFDGLTGAAIESHVRTAFTAMSIQQGYINRQGRRR